MVREILAALAPRPGELAIDCTLGYGGHSREILNAIAPGGRLLGLDVDPIELPKTERRLREAGVPEDSLIVRRSNFAGLSRVVAEVFPEGADIILADLGLSSMQLDDPARGFSFKLDAPLDMRMNPHHGQSAAALLARLDEVRLAELLVDHADEPRAAQLARAICNAHSRQPVTTTRVLADVIRGSLSDRGVPDEEVSRSIRRVFQALRIAVNDEFGALDSLLRQVVGCLRPGGRVAFLTFHSGEDRRVKLAFKSGLRDQQYAAVSEVIRPSAEEQHANPRSASAKLRVAMR